MTSETPRWMTTIPDAATAGATAELDAMRHMGDLERSRHHRTGPPDHLRWIGRSWHAGIPRGVCHTGTGTKGWRSRGESL